MVLLLQFVDGESAESLGLTGREEYTISGISGISPRQLLEVTAASQQGSRKFNMLARVDSPTEVSYFNNGGVLPFALRDILKS